MNKLTVIAGPTACGKTSVSIEVAKLMGGEIISADSMQVYKYMDIGTAKIKKEEMQGIKHYIVDELYPDEDFNVSVFQKIAKSAINEIHKQNKMPILVGGTGFYINALIYDIDFASENNDFSIREKLIKQSETQPAYYLYNKLLSTDKEYALSIDKNNTKKIIRALEYMENTGEKYSDYNKREKNKKPYYDVSFFILNMNRDRLYERINKRVDTMIAEGLYEEVKCLYEKYGEEPISMQGIGYKELIKAVKGECDIDEAVELIKKNTRHFAKRQLTWFKHQVQGTWIDVEKFKSTEDIAKYIVKEI
ncbi:MAG: tRNA (adenosine(37)-N6)-dimethylallyltransferase MiaA [Firmicutes bacterium]|nr:tRNA (adenosine(37)-N6)-dimethylallyltransferase MiaA [Bacillota bacterium]